MAIRVCAERTPRTAAVERLSAGDHACLGFDSGADRWALRAVFAADGLARGERVLLFGGLPAGEGPDAGLARLAAHGLAAGRAAAEGRLEVVTGASPGHDPAGGFDAAARTAYWSAATGDALDRGFAGLRAAGDMSWTGQDGLDAAELAAVTSYERDVTRLFDQIRLTGMCEYDRRAVPPRLFERMLSLHPLAVLPEPGALHAERDGDVLRLAGDADLATRAAFEFAVTESGLAVIDLTGLAFIDASCARALLRLTGEVVLECTEMQARILALCGPRQDEGVVARVR
jgi:hypothetical protein